MDRSKAFLREELVLHAIDLDHPGETLVSRSQGKRLLSRCESCREITIDFKYIDSIGPAFADEVFRVFARQNPAVVIRHQNANKEVLRMIDRAKNNGGATPTA